jgi:hypothetical protein
VLDYSWRSTAGPLHEGMRFTTACHTEMAMQLVAFWTIVSSATQSMLGRLPTEAF